MRSIVFGILVCTFVLCVSSTARAEDGPVVSVEGFGGFSYYYEDCCDGPGFGAGGAINATSDQGIGFRLQVEYHRHSVDVLGADADLDNIFVTGNFYFEAGEPGTVAGYGYLGGGWGRLEGTLGGFSVDANGGLMNLGGGLKFYFNDNVYFTPAVSLQRGFGDIESIQFNLTGGIGATFH